MTRVRNLSTTAATATARTRQRRWQGWELRGVSRHLKRIVLQIYSSVIVEDVLFGPRDGVYTVDMGIPDCRASGYVASRNGAGVVISRLFSEHLSLHSTSRGLMQSPLTNPREVHRGKSWCDQPNLLTLHVDIGRWCVELLSLWWLQARRPSAYELLGVTKSFPSRYRYSVDY